MGVSFYKSLDGTALLTSSAQLFDERGDGLVLRGGRAIEDKVNRHPYLSGDDAHALLAETLAAYRHEHHHFPARLVLHKSSRFHDEEREGFEQALGECGVDHESLTLTKMNWNNTQFDGALPITMKAARQVGDILKYVPDGQTIDPRYRFYM